MVKSVLMTFRVQGQSRIQQFETLEDLKKYIRIQEQVYENKIKPFIKEGQRFKNFQQNIEQYFSKKVQDDNEPLFQIEFLYKDKEDENQARIEKLKAKLDQRKISLDAKLCTEEEGQQLLMLKKFSKQFSKKENKNLKMVELLYLVSDPLVYREKQLKEKSKEEMFNYVAKKQFDFNNHQDIIDQAHAKNFQIDLKMRAEYLGRKSVQIVGKKNFESHAVICQVFASVTEESGLRYVLIQDDENIGLQTKMKVNEFFIKISKIKNLYLIIMVGFGLELIEEELHELQIKMPIILFPTFEVDDDQVYKVFIKNFYAHIFERKSIQKSFELASKQIQSLDSNFSCCCLHQHSDNFFWKRTMAIIGNSVGHKIFNHLSKTEIVKHKNFNKKLQQKLLNNPNLESDEFCKNHGRKRKIFSINLEVENILTYTEEQDVKKEKIRGSIKDKLPIERSTGRERNKVVYSFVQMLWKGEKQLICVTGKPKSGKSKFTSLALNYIKERKGKKFKYVDLTEEYKKSVSKTQKEIIKIWKQSKTEHLVFIIGRIQSYDHENFRNFYEKVMETITTDSRIKIIISSPTQLRKIDHQSFKISNMNKNEKIFFILKKLSEKFFKQNICNVLKLIEQSDLQLLELEQFISSLNQEPSLKINQIQCKLEEYREKQKNKNKIRLIQQNQKQIWNLFSFLSTFKEGINISQSNIPILEKMFKIVLNEETIKIQNNFFFQINYFKTNEQNKIKKGFLLKPNDIIIKESGENEKAYFQAKVIYFFKIFNSARLALQEIRRYYPEKRKFLNNEGIFIFKIKQEPSQWNFIKQMQFKQVQASLQHFLDYNLLNFIHFLQHIIKNSFKLSETLISQICLTIINGLILQKFYFVLPGEKTQFEGLICSFLEIIDSKSKSLNKIIIESQIYIFFSIEKLSVLKKKLSEENLKELTIRNMIIYEQNLKTFSDKKKYLSSISDEKKISTELGEIGRMIDLLMTRLNDNIEFTQVRNQQTKEEMQNQWEVKYQNIFKMILNLVIYKIALKFQYNIKATEEDQFSMLWKRSLEYQLNHYKKKCPEEAKNCEKQLLICNEYLSLSSRLPETGQFKFSHIQIWPELVPLYNYVLQKKNPAGILSKDNLLLFMKARCLEVKNRPCSFIRKGNIIHKYLSKDLEKKNVNLLFLNLTMDNLKFVSKAKPTIFCLVLSIDCKMEGERMKLYFENQYQGFEKIYEFHDFLELLRYIKFKFLFIFGAKSFQLVDRISKELKDENSAFIFAFSNNKKLLLSNYPEKIKLIQIIDEFVENQYQQRALQIIPCSIISQIIRKEGTKVERNTLEKITQIAIKMAEQILSKWEDLPFKLNINFRLFQLGSQQIYFPMIGEGFFQNISRKMNRIDHNFKDQTHYQTVGKNEEIIGIVNDLNKHKKCMIQISGKKKSGKRELLKELGWFCQTRQIFPLGVYLINMDNVRQYENINEYLAIIKHEEDLNLRLLKMSKMEDVKHCLLILLANLKPDDIIENKEFFYQISKSPISLIYTTSSDTLKQKFEKVKIEFEKEETAMKKNNSSLKIEDLHLSQKKSSSYAKKWQWNKISINDLKQQEKMCLTLVKIRHLPVQTYEQILESVIRSEKIQDKSDLYLLLKKVAEKIKKIPEKKENYQDYDCERLLQKMQNLQKKSIRIIFDLNI